MPEQPEVRIMSDFINSEIGHRDVLKIEKSPMSKNKCDLSILDNKVWRISSTSRGKEMIIELTSGEEKHSLKMGFAKIGSMESLPLSGFDQTYFDKRGMLRFYTKDKIYFISDFTRYTLWRWSDKWDANRSPDIVFEHNDWRAYIYNHRKIEYFKRPIFDILTDQRFFNGVGNFSRSEILCRTRFSPFLIFDEVLKSDVLREDFFTICKETLDDIADYGGLQFEHWRNPFGADNKKFNKWIRCYNKIPGAYFTKDSKGRKFWFKKQWVPDYIEWVKTHEVQDTRLLEKIYRKTK